MTLPTVFSFIALALPLVVAACGDRGESEPVDTFATRVEARAGVPFAEDGPVVTLEVPLTVVVGAPVPVKIRVKNATAAPLELYLRGRDVTFDLAVTDSSGDAIWRRLEGQATQAVLQLKTLAPGDAVDLSYTWDQKSQRGLQVPPGRYTIRGSLVTDGQSKVESPPATLDIMQR